MLEWYRSWPRDADVERIRERRTRNLCYVWDAIPRLLMTSQDYLTIGQHQDWPNHFPGFCMLEWDVALDQVDRIRFSGFSLLSPGEISVAPYRFALDWVHRRQDGSPIRDLDPRCDSFGLGCVYIPNRVLREWLVLGKPFTDQTFSAWYLANYGQARVCWDVRPAHVHEYDLEKA